MQLAEAGKLELDAPVIRYLPEFRTLTGDYEKITLRQCISHSAGLPGVEWLNFSVSNLEGVDYYREALNYFASTGLRSQPGTVSAYCNDGFTLAEMCVAAVCEEKSFSAYCKNHIADPIGAWSLRHADNRNPDYLPAVQRDGPQELVAAKGLAGVTATMEHLALFGNEFLRTGSKIVSPAIRREMCSPQGKSFLAKDTQTGYYGLGWSSVDFRYPGFDLGSGTLFKSGGSFQFSSKLLVVPKYNAVVCLSATYDCRLDTLDTAVRILALAMMSCKQTNITAYQEIPESLADRYAGYYLRPRCRLDVQMIGTFCYIYAEYSRGKRVRWLPPMGYTGKDFADGCGGQLAFDSGLGEDYLLTSYLGNMLPAAQKAVDGPAVSPAWEKRIGKRYINVSVTPFEEIVNVLLSGFTVRRSDPFQGILCLTIPNRDEAATAYMDCFVKPLNDAIAEGFLKTPTTSTGTMTPVFYEKNGIEYCTLASYEFRDCDSLPVYNGETFEQQVPGLRAFRFDTGLKELPNVPEGHRIMVLNRELDCVYDTLMPYYYDTFAPVASYTTVPRGYLIMV